MKYKENFYNWCETKHAYVSKNVYCEIDLDKYNIVLKLDVGLETDYAESDYPGESCYCASITDYKVNEARINNELVDLENLPNNLKEELDGILTYLEDYIDMEEIEKEYFEFIDSRF